MSSKSSSSIVTTENIDNSSLNGLATTRGDGNSVNILDAGAIKDALQFAGRAADGQAAGVGDMLKTFGTLANSTLTNAYKSSQDALDFADTGSRRSFDFADTGNRRSFDFADTSNKRSFDFAELSLDAINKNTNSTMSRLADASNGVNDAIMGAYTKAQNNGYNPQYIVMGVFALVALIMFKK